MSKPRKKPRHIDKAEAVKEGFETITSPEPEPTPEPEVKEPDWWTPEREKCFSMMQAGWPKTQIAETLKQHRNTIINWCNHAEFKSRMDDFNADRQTTTRQRRVVETTLLTDRAVRMANKMFDQAEASPRDSIARRAASEWLDTYRSMRGEERIDSGENVQKHAMQVSGAVTQVHVATTSFKGFLTESMKRMAIDVDAEITEENGHEALLMLTRQSLLESDVLDELSEHDAQTKLDPAYTQAEKKVQR